MKTWKLVILALIMLGMNSVDRVWAQAVNIATINLSATATETDAIDFNRTFGEIYMTDFNRAGRPLHIYDLNFSHISDMFLASPGYGIATGVIRDPVSGDFFFAQNGGTVRRFDSNGNFLGEFPDSNVGFAPKDITYHPSRDTLFISNLARVEEYNRDGVPLSFFWPATITDPFGLAFDPVSGTFLVGRSGGIENVDEFDLNGDLVSHFITTSPHSGNAQGFDYDPVTGNLYVTGQSALVEVWNDPDRPTLQVEIEVSLDIKPQSCPNPLNDKSKDVLPVAILGTEELDVIDIEIASLQLVGVSPIRVNFEDVATPFNGDKEICGDCTSEGPDGFVDLTLKFDMQEIVAALNSAEDSECLLLELGGNLTDGTPIVGRDVVRIKKKGLDHFKCYAATSEPFTPFNVTLADQFSPDGRLVRVLRPLSVCNPVEKSPLSLNVSTGAFNEIEHTSAVNHPDAHLTCYQIRDERFLMEQVDREDDDRRPSFDVQVIEPFSPRAVNVTNQFDNEFILTPRRAKSLCVPSRKDNPGNPAEVEAVLDHFKCYDVEPVQAEEIFVTLADQFHPDGQVAAVLKPVSVCNPVVKTHEERTGSFPDDLLNEDAHLTCYRIRDLRRIPDNDGNKIKQPKFTPRNVTIDNQFDEDQLFNVKWPETLCLPSLKRELSD